MRILLVTQHYPPEEGAHATRWGWITEALTARGHHIDVVVPLWASTDQATLPGTQVIRVKPRFPGLGLTARALNEVSAGLATLRSAASLQPDLVIATVPSLVALPTGWILARSKRVPFVLELRDAWPELFRRWRDWGDYGDGAQPGRAQTLLGPGFAAIAALLHWSRAHADAVVVTSERLAETLHSKGIGRIRLVRNAPNPDSPPPVGPAPVERTGPLRILYLGNIGRAQYLATAVRAAKLCTDRGISVTLRLIGHGAHRTAIEGLVQRLEAPVEVFDRIPFSQCEEQIEWADSLLVMLRDWPEFEATVPSKLYDALSTGRHITAALAGEAAEIVRTAGAGDVVAPQDPEALADLWCDIAKDRQRLQVNAGGRAWVDTHADRQQMGRDLAEFLESVSHG